MTEKYGKNLITQKVYKSVKLLYQRNCVKIFFKYMLNIKDYEFVRRLFGVSNISRVTLHRGRTRARE